MSLITQGEKSKLITVVRDVNEIKQIIFSNQKTLKPVDYSKPEVKVQTEVFLKLILQYGYKSDRIRQYVPVKMGADKREADIIVYNDDDCMQPHILVECKKQEVSEQEFLQAIEQAYSYAYALPNDVKYVWITSELKNEYFEVDKKKGSRVTLRNIPQYGVKIVSQYNFVYDADSLPQKEGKQKYFDLKIIEEDELTKRFKKAHDALWAGGQLNPSEAFDELDKLIFCKIWDERKFRKVGDPYDFQIITVDKEEIKNWQKCNKEQLENEIRKEENKRLFERIKELYEEGRKKDDEVFRDGIRLTPEKIRTVVTYLEEINLGETDLDAKGRAFETFMSDFFRGNFGQYFTPRKIVDFAISVLPIKNDSLVLDTSCGSGGFLLYALNKVRKQADALYPNHKNDVKQNAKHYKYWHDFAEKNLYGIEINEQISRAAKMNMIIHDDGHTNVITSDGLLHPDEIKKATTNNGFTYNTFDFIVTNPPFGSIIRLTEKAYMKTYKLGKKEGDWLAVNEKPETQRENQSTEILFIEQCYNFLNFGGYLAIVVPDGILTNSSLQYVRSMIEDKFRIVAVVSLPQTAFTATGAGVKSSVMFLKKLVVKQSVQLQNKIIDIQQSLKKQFNYADKITEWKKEKSKKTKEMEGFNNPNPSLTVAEIKKTEEYKAWKEELNTYYNSKVNGLKEQMQDAYLEAKQTQLPDYKIFMAIAEEIGYDAVGKTIPTNELNTIAKELESFINQIEEDII
jgi:type I restriction enzyme M protein